MPKIGLPLMFLAAISAAFCQTSSLPPGSIDGAVTPEQIPDAVVFRLFFAALAEPPSAASTQTGEGASSLIPLAPTARQQAKLSPVNLDANDTAVVLQALANFKAALTSATSLTANQGGAQSLDVISQNTLNTLYAQMSRAGFARLLTYVQMQKKYVRRVPYPMMNGPH